jgi:putative solute:sodium symporter small subunit
MKKGLTTGVIFFIIGFLVTIFHPLITQGETGILYGLYFMGIGAVIIIVILIIERVQDDNKFKKEYKKEDLRP